MSKEPIRFKQTEIGELPEEWEVVKLGEVAEVIMGQSPPGSSYNIEGFGIPFLQGKAEFGEKFPKHEKYTTKPQKIAKKGSILISVRAPVGDVNIANADYCIGRGLASVSMKNGNNEYLFYCLTYLKPTIEKIGCGSTFKAIRKNDLINLLIPLPPLEEQKRIARVLRLVDRVAEETRRIVNIYERAKRFALKRLLTRGIGHTRFKQTEIGELPEEWEVVRLEDVARVFSGSSAPQGREYFENGIFPFVRVQDLARYGQTRCLTEVTDKVNERAVQEHHMVLARKGTILFPKSGAALEKNHRAILGVDAYIVSHLAAVEANPEKVDNEFLFWWLCRIDMASLNPNPGYPSIRLEEIKNLTIPLPPLEEQKQIAEMLGTIDAAIENERRYLGVLEKCKRWLLDNLLTGKIRLSPEVDEILKGVLPDAF
jgi:type I restriction enzyme S subunit